MQELTISEFITNHSFLVGTFAALVTLLIYTEFQIRTRRFSEVKPSEAVALINRENAVIVDVRSQKEFEEGHIVNAINIPLEGFERDSTKLSKHKDKHVITYCRSGNTSQRACKQLEKEGFTTIHNLKGGVLAWERDNLPLTKGKK